ncbi:MAG: DUF4239 domain-containing protein, partial [Kiritimatiellaeota bacterium]|nr:DUF4239 domain-containing protein [Kiritimatiellota bacterium]
ERVGFTYAVFGLIYGVLLAFTIIVAWERFAETERIVMHETTVLSELWRDIKVFPPADRDGIHSNLMAYAQSVVEDEWPVMGAQGRANPKTAKIYEQLWDRTYVLHPETKIQEAYLTEVLGDISQVSANRRLRLLYSRTEINSILWLVLLLGAAPTVGYTLLFANKHGWVQILITMSVMLIVSLSLLVVLSLQYPFTGDVSIQPEAFRDLLESFQRRLLSAGVGG